MPGRRFRVRFSGDFALWARERRWAEDQAVEEDDRGVTLTFTSSQYGKVLEWVLGKGAWAEPLEPPELVRDWASHIEGMQKNLPKPQNNSAVSMGDTPEDVE